MRFDTESTICAIATGTEGAIRGAIRITGPCAVSVACSICDNQNSIDWNSKVAVNFAESISLQQLGQLEATIYLWPDQRSYTGQPTVEIHCIGNVIVLQAIQSRLLEQGAVLAQAGEFTLRAFLAGRLDLTQCEAVLGVIHAANNRALHVALTQLAGGLSEPLQALRTSLVNLLADIEAGLDFVDEDIEFISRDQIVLRLCECRNIVTQLLKQMDSRASQTVQLQVAIVGAPNAGKSSLVNALAQRQVSIVSPEPGTTRDYVRLRLDFDGVLVDLIDTAGVEKTLDHSPRSLAQDVTRERIQHADLILYCLASDDANSPEWNERPETTTPIWLLKTKCDLPACARVIEQTYDYTMMLSIHHGNGMRELLSSIERWATDQHEKVSQVVPITSARCHASLSQALESLALATEATEGNYGDEVVAGEIRLALESIGMVAGTVYTDDILDALFSRFCIGK